MGSHDDALRERVVLAAADLLVAAGDPSRVAVADVCARAGCTPPTVYHHFGSKAGLLRAAAHHLHDRLAARLADAVAGLPDPEARVAARGLTYLRLGLEQPAVYRVLFDSPVTAAAPDVTARPDVAAAPTPGRAVQDLADDVAAMTGTTAEAALPLAVGLWGTVHGLTLLGITNPSVPRAALEAALAAVVGVVGAAGSRADRDPKSPG